MTQRRNVDCDFHHTNWKEKHRRMLIELHHIRGCIHSPTQECHAWPWGTPSLLVPLLASPASPATLRGLALCHKKSLKHQPSLACRVSVVCAHHGHLSSISRGPKARAAWWLLDHCLMPHGDRLPLEILELAGWNGWQNWDSMSSTCRDLGTGQTFIPNVISVLGFGNKDNTSRTTHFLSWFLGPSWLVPVEGNRKSVFCDMMSTLLHDGDMDSTLVCVMGSLHKLLNGDKLLTPW